MVNRRVSKSIGQERTVLALKEMSISMKKTRYKAMRFKLRGRMIYSPIQSPIQTTLILLKPKTTHHSQKICLRPLKHYLNMMTQHLNNQKQQEETHLKVSPSSMMNNLDEGNVDERLQYTLTPALLMSMNLLMMD